MNASFIYDSWDRFLRKDNFVHLPPDDDPEADHFKMHRGCLELTFTQVDEMVAFVRHFADEGWRPTRVNDAQRLLVGFEFDCRGDDFDKFRVFIRVNDMRLFFMRYEGVNELRPQRELVDAVNNAMRLPESGSCQLSAFDDVLWAEKDYILKRNRIENSY